MAYLRLGLILLLGLAESGLCLKWDFEYNGYEYFITPSSSEDDYTWYDARDACMAEGGDLLTVETEAEDNWLSNQYVSYYGNLWLGLNRLRDGRTWEWVDGKTSSVENWYSSEPRVNENCCLRSSRTSKYWYSENCGEHKGFYCKRPKGVVTPKTTIPTTPVPGYCPRGWIDSGTNRCYKAFAPISKAIKWSAAQDLCKSQPYLGADLACANEASEVSMLSILGSHFDRSISLWIGVYRTYYNNEQWKWSDNTQMKLTNFHDLYSTYDDGCGFTSSLLKPAGSWDVDGTCTYTKNGYICQMLKDPANTIPTPGPTSPNTCQSGYTPYEQGCFKVFPEAKTFEQSRSACESAGANLVDIHSDGENSVVQFLLAKVKIAKAWIGLQYNTDKNEYRWINNWYVNYVNWGPGQPSKNDGGGCVALQNEDRSWYDTACSTQLPFICKTTSKPPVTEPPDKPGRCPNNEWMPIGGYCYHVCSTGCDSYWLVQEEKCRKLFRDARIASIHDDVTNDKIYQALKDDYTSGDGWLGLFKSSQNGKWRWLDNTPLAYTNWATNQPPSDPSSSKHCAWMSLSSSSPGQWFAGTCESEYRGLVCKVEKVENPATPAPVNGTCPTNMWSQYGDKCYLFRPDEFANWDTANQHCISEGGSEASLAIVTSFAHNDFVHLGMLSTSHLPGSRNYWIGLARKGAGYPYQWLDGKNVSEGFSHWAPGQPSSTTSKLCVEMNMNSAMWHNQVCSNFLGYACQVAVVPIEADTPSPPSGPDAGTIVGIVFGVIVGIVLVLGIAFIIYRQMNGNPVIDFNRFTNPPDPTTVKPAPSPGFSPPTFSENDAYHPE